MTMQMDATIDDGTKNHAADANEQNTPSLAAFLTLPRELRDNIYNHLLTSTSRINLAPKSSTQNAYSSIPSASSIQQRNHHITGPLTRLPGRIVFPPNSDNYTIIPRHRILPTPSAPWDQQQTTTAPLLNRNTGTPVSPRLNILSTSNQMHNEALETLFKKSVFRYIITSPGLSITPLSTTTKIQNLLLTLNISFTFPNFPAQILVTASTILTTYHKTLIERKTIRIDILHRRAYDLLVQDEFAHALGGLIGFERLEIRIGNLVRRDRSADDGDEPALVISNDEDCVAVYRGLCAMLRGKLGEAVLMRDGEKWFRVVFYPRRWVVNVARLASLFTSHTYNDEACSYHTFTTVRRIRAGISHQGHAWEWAVTIIVKVFSCNLERLIMLIKLCQRLPSRDMDCLPCSHSLHLGIRLPVLRS